MERLLSEITEKLRKAHGDALLSVILYGSAAAPEGRDQRSDYNILCVLRQVTPAELTAAEPVLRWWREMKNPAPLLMSMDEAQSSPDAFPMEYQDMREHRIILFGQDVIQNLVIQQAYYRAQVEHELRAKLLRLRQKAGSVLTQPDLLLRLMLDSVSTFCVLFRHALILAGDQPRFGKRDVIAAAGGRFGINTAPFDTLLDIREKKLAPRQVKDPVNLLGEYLTGIGKVIGALDRIVK